MMPYTELQFRPGSSTLLEPGVIFLGGYRAVLRRRLRGLHQQEHLHAARDDASFFDRARISDRPSIVQLRATDDGITEQRFDFDTGITVSNGGLNAPLGDMAKYLAFLIDGNETILNDVARRDVTPQIVPRRRGGSGTTCKRVVCFIERHGGVELIATAAIRTGSSRTSTFIGRRDPATSSRQHDVTSKRDPKHTTRAVERPARRDRAPNSGRREPTMTLDVFVRSAPRCPVSPKT